MIEDKMVELPSLGLGESGSNPDYHKMLLDSYLLFQVRLKVLWQSG